MPLFLHLSPALSVSTIPVRFEVDVSLHIRALESVTARSTLSTRHSQSFTFSHSENVTVFSTGNTGSPLFLSQLTSTVCSIKVMYERTLRTTGQKAGCFSL
jgi:hypothetical protein